MGRAPCCSKQRLNRGAWSKKEDMILTEYIRLHGDGGWENLPRKAGLTRCGKSCRLRWINYLRPDIKRGNISPDEHDLIVRMHRLLGNRWSLIAGRLPGRTDNEIRNYWNTCLNKKQLSMNKHQPNFSSQIVKASSNIPCPALPNRVYTTTPVKPTAVIYSEILRPNRCNGYGRSNDRSDEAVKLCNVKENTNSVTDYDSKITGSAMADVNLFEKDAGNCSYSIWSLEEETLPHSYCFAEDTATLYGSLLELNNLSSPDCNLVSSSFSGVLLELNNLSTSPDCNLLDSPLSGSLLEFNNLSTPDCNLLSSPFDCSTYFEFEEFYGTGNIDPRDE